MLFRTVEYSRCVNRLYLLTYFNRTIEVGRRQAWHRRGGTKSYRRAAGKYLHAYARRACQDCSLPTKSATRHSSQPGNRNRK